MTLAYIFASIICIFVGLLLVKQWLGFSVCAICLSIGGTWLGLLAMYHLSTFNDPVILALLMGGSVIGVYYMVERRVPEQLTIFRLPFLLTLFLMAYSAIVLSIAIPSFIVVGSVWVAAGLIFALQDKPAIRRTAKSIIDCCSKW